MAKAKKTAQTSAKVKKKLWFKLQAPKLFNNRVVGDTLAESPEKLNGRVVSLSLMNIMGDIKKQNNKVHLKVKEVKGETAFTEVSRYEVIPVALKRLVRKGKSRVDDSFVCKTSDNILVRIKPMMLVNSKLKGSIETALRERAASFIINYAKKSTYENLLRDIISTKFQRQVSGVCKKVYPVRMVEVKVLEVTSPTSKKAKVRKAKIVLEEKKEEPKQEEAKTENEAPAKEAKQEE